MNREDEFNEKPHENEEVINEVEEVKSGSEEVQEEPLYVEPKEKTDPYVYRGGSSYEPGVEERRRKKKFSGFSLIAIALIFTLLGTSLGVYGAFNILPETDFFLNSKLGQMVLENKNETPTFVATPELLEEGLTIPQIVEMVQPAVVTVSVQVPGTTGWFNPQGSYSESIGTGFILNEEGLIATNYHVVENGEEIKVTLYDGQEVSAKLVNYDASNDLAVLQMDENVKVPGVVTLGDSSSLKVGESVIAIGNPLSKEFAGTVTSGIISATERAVTIGRNEYTYIQTDAAINGGNSGGPLINARGEVIGINSAKIATESVEGIGFAIPINTLIDGLDALSKAQLIIGIAGRGVDEETASANDIVPGVLVMEVQNNTPAYIAAIMVGDIITEFDGQKVTSVEELNKVKNTKEAGDEVVLKIYRDGEYIDLKLTLRERN
ncbi:S1C family serine protease [Proteiniclasticum ruminis]|uniref:Serine protease Do n=1 Tax=Proteiniclasticum ruminis TaxID=398199 RepID=A0A1I4ZPJ1_9CLOT|nr:trypsin-like peptidase domain-containing protein [Proteiniclasticum ruminis]SFN52181.1 serine protease Do [Proteiniclasticum ruminis]